MLGYRLNVAQETLRPRVDATDGRRSLVAFAGDMRLGGGSLLQGEFEWSSHTQASVPGQSLLGPALPPVLSPNININNQSWSQANDFDNLTGTLRFEQALGNNWDLVGAVWRAVAQDQRPAGLPLRLLRRGHRQLLRRPLLPGHRHRHAERGPGRYL